MKFKLENDFRIDLTSRVLLNAEGEEIGKQQDHIVINDIERVQEVEKFSKTVSQSIADVVSSLEKSNCLSVSDKKSILATASGMLQEVTAVGSVFAGPYALPLAVGGSIVTGIFKGIDSIISKRKAGYDFVNSEEDRLLFSSFICTYENIRKEIDDSSFPYERLAGFQILKDVYADKIELVLKHELGKKYQALYLEKKKSLQSLESIRTEIIKIKSFSNPNQKCLAYVRLVEEVKGTSVETYSHLRKSLQGLDHLTQKGCLELSQINERNLIWEALLENALVQTSDDLTKKEAALIKLGEEERLQRSQSQPNRVLDRANFVVWTKRSLERMEWINQELLETRRLLSTDSALLQSEIANYRTYLDRLINNKLAPLFVRSLRKLKNRDLRKFNKEHQEVFEQIIELRNQGKTLGDKILGAINNPFLDDRDHIRMISSLDGLMGKWMRFKYRRNAIRRYCQYFFSIGLFEQKVENLCNKEGLIIFNRYYRQADGEIIANEPRDQKIFKDQLKREYHQNKRHSVYLENIENFDDFFKLKERIIAYNALFEGNNFEQLLDKKPGLAKSRELNNVMQIHRSYQDYLEYGFSSLDIVAKILHYLQWAKSPPQNYVREETLKSISDKIRSSVNELREFYSETAE